MVESGSPDQMHGLLGTLSFKSKSVDEKHGKSSYWPDFTGLAVSSQGHQG